jgi:D-proline reductase (dithiol) PrdB
LAASGGTGGGEAASPPLELSRYCVPYTPFTKALATARLCLVTTAGVYHPNDPPFNAAGDNSFRVIPGDAAACDLRYSDEHYPHDCVDADLNCVFPIDRVKELASEGVIGGTTASHFSMGYTQQLAEIRKTTLPALARAIDKVRPDAVILTGG